MLIYSMKNQMRAEHKRPRSASQKVGKPYDKSRKMCPKMRAEGTSFLLLLIRERDRK